MKVKVSVEGRETRVFIYKVLFMIVDRNSSLYLLNVGDFLDFVTGFIFA